MGREVRRVPPNYVPKDTKGEYCSIAIGFNGTYIMPKHMENQNQINVIIC